MRGGVWTAGTDGDLIIRARLAVKSATDCTIGSEAEDVTAGDEVAVFGVGLMTFGRPSNEAGEVLRVGDFSASGLGLGTG